MAALLVAELALSDLVTIDEEGVVVAARPEPGSFADLLATVVSEKGPNLKFVLYSVQGELVGTLGLRTWEYVVAGLVHGGVIVAGSGGTQLHIVDPGVRAEILSRLRYAAESDVPLDDRTAMLLSMIGRARLLEVVVPDRSRRRRAGNRMDRALEHSAYRPLSVAVHGLVADMAAASSGGSG